MIAREIERRLDAVEAMVKDLVAREELRRAMDGILDLERLLSRVTLEAANPRDLLTLAASFAKLPGVRAALARFLGGAAATAYATHAMSWQTCASELRRRSKMSLRSR